MHPTAEGRFCSLQTMTDKTGLLASGTSTQEHQRTQTNKQTNERTNEQTNKQTNKQTKTKQAKNQNKRTNKQKKHIHTHMCAALASTRTSLQLRLATAIHSAAARVLQVHLHARLRRTNFVDSGPFSAYDMRLQALSLGLSSWTDSFGITFQAKRETETETLQPLCTSRVFPLRRQKGTVPTLANRGSALAEPFKPGNRFRLAPHGNFMARKEGILVQCSSLLPKRKALREVSAQFEKDQGRSLGLEPASA